MSVSVIGRDLQEDLLSDTGGYFEKLLICELNGERDESSVVDREQAAADAQAILDVSIRSNKNSNFFLQEHLCMHFKIELACSQAGEGQWGTDEAEINQILCQRNYDQLIETFKIYQKLSDRDIEDAIKSECTGHLQDAFLAISKFRMTCGYCTSTWKQSGLRSPHTVA